MGLSFQNRDWKTGGWVNCTGAGDPSQLGFGDPSQPGFGEPSQPGFGDPSQLG